jgi:imidazolonepropionase-like amidohydrolase
MNAHLKLAVLLAVLVNAGAAAQTLVIEDGAIVDTRNGAVLEHRTILVEDDRITRVAHAGEISTPSNAEVVTARGLWVLPGLIDMHVHGSSRADVPLALYVANGVTSIRDLGGPLAPLQLLRNELEAGKRLGPRLYFVGPILDGAPPAAPSISIIVDTAARAASTVDFLIDQGVDAIKVYNGISAPVLQAIVERARHRSVPVVGHVPRAITASQAVELGMSMIEHSAIRAADLAAWNALTQDEVDRIRNSQSVTAREAMVWRHVDLTTREVAALIERFATARIFLDPTLSVDEFDSLFLYPDQAAHPNNRFLKRSFVNETLGPDHQTFKVPDELKGLARTGVEKRRRFIGMCHRGGVSIVAGTDGPGIGTLAPGFGLHRELELLVAAGLTPMDALRAATLNAAAALGQEENLGVVEAGKLADIVLVRADPRVNIGNASRVEAVVLRGQLFDRNDLDAMLDEAAREAQ